MRDCSRERCSLRLLHDDGEIKLRLRNFSRDVDAYFARLQNVLPARTGGFDSEVLHIHLSTDGGGWNWQMGEHHAGQGAFHQFGYKARGAGLYQSRRQFQKLRFAQGGAYAQNPAGMAKATFIKNLSGLNVGLHRMKVERDGIRWNHNLKVSPDVGVEGAEGRAGTAVIVSRKLAGSESTAKVHNAPASRESSMNRSSGWACRVVLRCCNGGIALYSACRNQ